MMHILIFEVLNSKGKDLAPVDMIKNSLFSILTEDEPLDYAVEKWKEIKRNLKNCVDLDINIFYRHFGFQNIVYQRQEN